MLKLKINNYGLNDEEYYLCWPFKVIKKIYLDNSKKIYREYISRNKKQLLQALLYRVLAIFRKRKIYWYYFLIKSLRFEKKSGR